MIEFPMQSIDLVIDVRGMMGLEVTMNDFGVLAAFGLGDVNVLGRQQRQAEEAEYSSDGERAPERHSGGLSVASDDASILSES